ncbi:MAG: glycosyltransferase [Oricola sp.]
MSLRILSLSTSGEKCGIATYNDQLGAAFRAIGAEFDTHPIDRAGSLKKTRREFLHHFDAFIARTRDCDAILVQHEHAFFMGNNAQSMSPRVFARLLRALAATRKPVVVIFHSAPLASGSFLSRRRYYWNRVLAILRANPQIALFTHGEHTVASYIEAGIESGRMVSVPHPLPRSTPVRCERSANDPVVLTIFGFTVRYKGYDVALEALRRLPDRFRLLAAGGPNPNVRGDPTFGMLAEAARSDEFSGRLEITGWIEEGEIADAMARTDIALAPYARETNLAGSGALTWAICHAVPVIASDAKSFAAIQAEAGCLSIVPCGDPAALAARIVELWDDAPERARLVENGLVYARERSWESLARSLLPKLFRA